ncbi:hypothetical protein Val02_01060 [Virgisporangium aliadipatigenens]|uniref:eCIS core domain-containing protein n=1 Tax=Virgisporangium aliadipatigenens TaxID=741659 RepID=A0A8J3YFP8_9ACTN|nr:hypothetical protein Val02_01060 [Virgisporangium aliadipatigenens]
MRRLIGRRLPLAAPPPADAGFVASTHRASRQVAADVVGGLPTLLPFPLLTRLRRAELGRRAATAARRYTVDSGAAPGGVARRPIGRAEPTVAALISAPPAGPVIRPDAVPGVRPAFVALDPSRRFPWGNGDSRPTAAGNAPARGGKASARPAPASGAAGVTYGGSRSGSGGSGAPSTRGTSPATRTSSSAAGSLAARGAFVAPAALVGAPPVGPEVRPGAVPGVLAPHGLFGLGRAAPTLPSSTVDGHGAGLSSGRAPGQTARDGLVAPGGRAGDGTRGSGRSANDARGSGNGGSAGSIGRGSGGRGAGSAGFRGAGSGGSYGSGLSADARVGGFGPRGFNGARGSGVGTSGSGAAGGSGSGSGGARGSGSGGAGMRGSGSGTDFSGSGSGGARGSGGSGVGGARGAGSDGGFGGSGAARDVASRGAHGTGPGGAHGTGPGGFAAAGAGSGGAGLGRGGAGLGAGGVGSRGGVLPTSGAAAPGANGPGAVSADRVGMLRTMGAGSLAAALAGGIAAARSAAGHAAAGSTAAAPSTAGRTHAAGSGAASGSASAAGRGAAAGTATGAGAGTVHSGHSPGTVARQITRSRDEYARPTADPHHGHDHGAHGHESLAKRPATGPTVSSPVAAGDMRVLGGAAMPPGNTPDPAGAVQRTPPPPSIIGTPVQRWSEAVKRRPLEAPRELPAAFQAMARSISGRAYAPRYTTGPATRAALSAAGALGATSGGVVHLPSHPNARNASVLAHELTHTRQSVRRPRFFLSRLTGAVDDDERAALHAGHSHAQGLIGSATQQVQETGAGIVGQLPVAGASMGRVNEVATNAANQAIADANGAVDGALGSAQSAVDGAVGGAQDWFTGVSGQASGYAQQASGYAQQAFDNTNNAVNGAQGAVAGALPSVPGAAPNNTPGGQAEPVDPDRIVEMVEERLLRELERRGGRWNGVF